VRRGLATFLKVFDDLELVGEAADGESAIQLCAQILLTGSNTIEISDVTNDGSGHLYVSSGVGLLISSNLSPCSRVFNGGELIISKGSLAVTLERELAIYGNLSLVNNPSVSFGKHGGALTMHPGSSPSVLIFNNFVIEQNAQVLLKSYAVSPLCRWELQVNQLELGIGAQLNAECNLTYIGNKIIMKETSKFTIGSDLVSNFTVNDLDISGTFLPGIASFGVGLETIIINHKGLMRLRPYDYLGINELTINGQLLLESNVFIRGRAPAVSSKITVGPHSRLELAVTDLPPLSSAVPFLNGSSRIHAQDVTIGGEFIAKKLLIDTGWKSLTIDSSGKFEFTPINPFSFGQLVINGNFTSVGALHLRGLSKSVIPHLKVGSSGILNIISSLNTSIIHADQVTFAGNVLVNKLSIDPGWKSLTVEKTGTFHFDPINSFAIDSVIIDGKITSISALSLKGLSQNTVSRLSVGSNGVVLIQSKDVTTLLCDDVLIGGMVTIGLLEIGSGWKKLDINESQAQFHFEANTSYSIDDVRVSGLLQTSTVFGQDNPFTAQTFKVLSGGTVNIHNRGASSGYNQGALDTTILVNTLQVDGLLQSGSLQVNASVDVLVGSSGHISVNSGGCVAGQGLRPGRGSSSGGSGANHGGRGGRGGGITALSSTYGDIFSISTWGSGGGDGTTAGSGGRGGGRIRLFVKNRLHVDGQIEMNGDPGKVR